MMVMQYVITVTHYLAERNGQPPEHAEIEQELATRCLDLMERNKELTARAVDAEMRLAMYEVSRP